jgi:hypothetical protein
VTALATDRDANTQTVSQTVNNNSGGTLGEYDAFVAYVDSPQATTARERSTIAAFPFATIAAAQAAAAIAKGTQHDPGACAVLLEAGGYTWGDYAWGRASAGRPTGCASHPRLASRARRRASPARTPTASVSGSSGSTASASS